MPATGWRSRVRCRADLIVEPDGPERLARDRWEARLARRSGATVPMRVAAARP